MLFTYTPNEQTEVNALAVKKVFELHQAQSRSTINLYQKCNITELSFTTSWCREVATSNLSHLVGQLPPGKLNIYGIRKHGEACPSQPREVSGKIRQRETKVNVLFHNLFQFITEMLCHIFKTDTEELHSTKHWLYNLASSAPAKVNPLHSMDCLLNYDPELIPTTPLWTTDDMYGTMFNIPSEWAKSTAAMSYLLYLPRVWGAFYETDGLLPKMLRLSKLRSNTRAITFLCGVQELEDSMCLWRYIARRLMLPLWFTNYGREGFWMFTYLLIKEGIAAKEGLPRVPGLLKALTEINRSGFISWLRTYKIKDGTKAPDWVRKLYNVLGSEGPFSLLNLRSIVGYV